MKGGRLILILGFVMALIAGVLVIAVMGQRTGSSAITPTPEPLTVVRAAQNIAKGEEVRLDAVQLVRMEAGEPLPPRAAKDPMAVAGMMAAMDIPQGTIIQEDMYYDRENMVELGTSASKLFEPGRVAVAFPIGDLSGVGGALRPGDRVDVIASLELVDVDPELQARLPLNGKADQLPRMVVQLTLQNIEVLRVGPWPGGGPEQPGKKEDTPPPPTARMVTLLVPQQDALVLKLMLDKMDEGQARVALALRSEEDESIVETEAVTLDYLMRRFKITVPPKGSVATDEIRVKGSLQVR